MLELDLDLRPQRGDAPIEQSTFAAGRSTQRKHVRPKVLRTRCEGVAREWGMRGLRKSFSGTAVAVTWRKLCSQHEDPPLDAVGNASYVSVRALPRSRTSVVTPARGAPITFTNMPIARHRSKSPRRDGSRSQFGTRALLS